MLFYREKQQSNYKFSLFIYTLSMTYFNKNIEKFHTKYTIPWVQTLSVTSKFTNWKMYVRLVKSNIQGRAFPNRATRERLSIGRMVRWGEPYHAGAELLQKTRALRASRRASGPNALHAAAQEERNTAAGIRHAASLRNHNTSQSINTSHQHLQLELPTWEAEECNTTYHKMLWYAEGCSWYQQFDEFRRMISCSRF